MFWLWASNFLCLWDAISSFLSVKIDFAFLVNKESVKEEKSDIRNPEFVVEVPPSTFLKCKVDYLINVHICFAKRSRFSRSFWLTCFSNQPSICVFFFYKFEQPGADPDFDSEGKKLIFCFQRGKISIFLFYFSKIYIIIRVFVEKKFRRICVHCKKKHFRAAKVSIVK
jgi:hypothetical protein